jgi:hypothetical protein
MAALLCVLLIHAVAVHLLFSVRSSAVSRGRVAEFISEPITMFLEPLDEPAEPRAGPQPSDRVSVAPALRESNAIVVPAPAAAPARDRVDWPVEGRKSVARILAREAEAERVAKMFAGPGGTWASLTKRQRSKISKFRWKPGVDGLERDANGNTIYHLSEGCVIVNFSFIGCAIGKPKIHDDMFDNMRQYFDEQRLPQTNEGNGTEPGARPLP